MSAIQLGARLIEPVLTDSACEPATQQFGVHALAGKTMMETGIVQFSGTGLPHQTEDVACAVWKVLVEPGFEQFPQFKRQA